VAGTKVSFTDRGHTHRSRFSNRSRLVVCAARPGTAKGLLPNHRAGRLVIDAEVAGGEPQHLHGLDNRRAVLCDDRSGEPVWRDLGGLPNDPVVVGIVGHGSCRRIFESTDERLAHLKGHHLCPRLGPLDHQLVSGAKSPTGPAPESTSTMLVLPWPPARLSARRGPWRRRPRRSPFRRGTDDGEFVAGGSCPLRRDEEPTRDAVHSVATCPGRFRCGADCTVEVRAVPDFFLVSSRWRRRLGRQHRRNRPSR